MLEACVIIADNSEYSRNGDYNPNRLDAQRDAAQVIQKKKMASNPESAVGLMALGDSTLLVAPTADELRFHRAIADLVPEGTVDLTRSIQKAQLALKHRSNKNQRQRIILFVASPLNPSLDLTPLGRNLKKNNISIDVISIGSIEENHAILTQFVNAVNANAGCHLVEIKPTEGLLSSAILRNGSLFGGPVADSLGLDVDPDADPELFMALQMSLREEEARQRALAGQTATQEAPLPEPPAPSGSRTPMLEDIYAMDIDEDLRQALILSLQESGPSHESDDDDAELAAAIALSTQLNNDEDEKDESASRDA